MKPIVVAVDGPAGSGKSSVSKRVAKERGLTYIDSGALYRSITWFLLQKYGELKSGEDYVSSIAHVVFSQEYTSEGETRAFIDGRDISKDIRSEEVVKSINVVSSDSKIREFVTKLLRTWARSKSIIMDGRDIATVVFPNADIKIYLDASVDKRAERRAYEYETAGKKVDVNDIKNQIILRDERDRSRDVGALIQSKDAVVIDSSRLTYDEVVNRFFTIIDNAVNLQKEKPGVRMENVDNIFEDNVSMDELFNETSDPESGEILNGEVVSHDENFVYVNVGGKTEGRVPRHEFDELPPIGAKIDVFVKKGRSQDGMFQLSHKQAKIRAQWEKFVEWQKDGHEIVKGKILTVQQNGAIVDFGVNTGFIPKNHAADIRFKDAVSSGAEYDFKIIKVDAKKRSVILSRKELLDEVRQKAWDEIVATKQEGDVVHGKVARLVEFGAFVDIGGFEALLHNNDVSWRKVFSRKEYIKSGDELDVKILSINKEDRKISLGLKQMQEDPWASVESRYTLGAVYDGTIVAVTNYGVFVEVEEGVEGLVASDETQWVKKAPNPKGVFKKGEAVSVKVLAVKPDERTMSLSIKQAQPNPWDTIENRFPIGSVQTGAIKSKLEFGLFVELEESVDAFIHVSDLAWDEAGKKAMESYNQGDTVEFKILSISPAEMKVSAGIKQLKKSPWELVKEKYPPRTRVKGEVTSIKNFGLFVKLEENVEGLVHISEVSREKIENLEDKFKVGDSVEVAVLDVDAKKKKMSLSIKSLEAHSEKEEVSMILNAQSSSTATLGDLTSLANLINKSDEEKK